MTPDVVLYYLGDGYARYTTLGDIMVELAEDGDTFISASERVDYFMIQAIIELQHDAPQSVLHLTPVENEVPRLLDAMGKELDAEVIIYQHQPIVLRKD